MDICRLMRPFFVRSVTRRGSSPVPSGFHCKQMCSVGSSATVAPAPASCVCALLAQNLPAVRSARHLLSATHSRFTVHISSASAGFDSASQLRSRLRCSPEYGPSAAGLRSGRKVPARKQNHLSGVFSELANSENGQYRTRWRTCASSPLPKKKWPG